MSLKKFFASVAHAVGVGGHVAAVTVSAATLATVYEMGNSLAGSIAAAGDQSNPIGAAIASGIKAADDAARVNPGMTNGEKLTKALETTTPVVISEAAKLGLTGVEAEAARWAEMAIENELSLMKATPLAKLGAALLHEVGVSF